MSHLALCPTQISASRLGIYLMQQHPFFSAAIPYHLTPQALTNRKAFQVPWTNGAGHGLLGLAGTRYLRCANRRRIKERRGKKAPPPGISYSHPFSSSTTLGKLGIVDNCTIEIPSGKARLESRQARAWHWAEPDLQQTNPVLP